MALIVGAACSHGMTGGTGSASSSQAIGDHLAVRRRQVVGDVVDRAGDRMRHRRQHGGRRCPRHGCARRPGRACRCAAPCRPSPGRSRCGRDRRCRAAGRCRRRRPPRARPPARRARRPAARRCAAGRAWAASSRRPSRRRDRRRLRWSRDSPASARRAAGGAQVLSAGSPVVPGAMVQSTCEAPSIAVARQGRRAVEQVRLDAVGPQSARPFARWCRCRPRSSRRPWQVWRFQGR